VSPAVILKVKTERLTRHATWVATATSALALCVRTSATRAREELETWSATAMSKVVHSVLAVSGRAGHMIEHAGGQIAAGTQGEGGWGREVQAR